MMHFVVGTLGFTARSVSVASLQRGWCPRRGMQSLARLSFASGIVVLIAFFGGGAFANRSGGILGIWISVVAGWAWLAALSLRLYRIAPDPNCAPR